MMVIVLAWLLLLNAAIGLPLRVANPDKDLDLGQAIGQGSTPPTIHAIQNRAQTVRTLFLNASVEPGVETATIEMVTMSQLLRDVPRFRSTLYCTYEPIVEEITSDTSSTALANLTTFHSVSLVQGIVPSTLEIPDTTIVMDPINTTSGPRLVQSNVVYLFPTLFQQLIVYGKYLRSVGNNTSIRVVAHPERVTDFRDSVLTMGASLDYSHIGIDSVVLYNNNITDALHPSATNIVLGLGSADVQLLVEFLEKNADAIVVITFDELTIFYTSLRTYYGSAYRPSMDRLRYVTNLPRWSVRPSSKRSTTFLEFFDPSVDAVRGPAALRTFATAFLVDFLSYDINSLSTPNALEDALYTNRVFSVDDELEFGPFRQDCSYPTMDSLSCLLNYGARNLRVWDFGSTYLTDSKALYGPITVYLIGDALVIEDGAFRKNWFLVVSGIVMGLNAIVLAFVAWGCASGRFDRSWEVVTVLHVGIHHHLPPCRVDELERALQNYSDRVDELYNTFHCLEVDSTSDAFTVVSRNASDLLCFADRLGPALHDVEQQMHLGPLLDLRMGLHTALCRCSRELDEEDLHPLSTILAPVKMLAQCLAQLGEGNGDVLLSQWACAAAVREQLPGELSLLGEYQLDRESTMMQVFRFVGESWSSREVPSTRKAKAYTPGDGEVQVAANPLKVQLSFSSDLFSNSAELTSQVLLF